MKPFLTVSSHLFQHYTSPLFFFLYFSCVAPYYDTKFYPRSKIVYCFSTAKLISVSRAHLNQFLQYSTNTKVPPHTTTSCCLIHESRRLAAVIPLPPSNPCRVYLFLIEKASLVNSSDLSCLVWAQLANTRHLSSYHNHDQFWTLSWHHRLTRSKNNCICVVLSQIKSLDLQRHSTTIYLSFAAKLLIVHMFHTFFSSHLPF